MRILKDVMLLSSSFSDRLGRIYDRLELSNQISSKKLMYGELGAGGKLHDNINLSKVSHYIDNIRITDNGIIADIHIVDTPCGKIVESLLDAGVKLKTSICALGVVDSNLIVKDLKLITFDLVED